MMLFETLYWVCYWVFSRQLSSMLILGNPRDTIIVFHGCRLSCMPKWSLSQKSPKLFLFVGAVLDNHLEL